MPLGDSITDGSPTPGGYRYPLYVALTNAGYNVDYVGTLTINPTNALGLEVNHEGHSGWKISDATVGLYENMFGWLEAIDDPHVVLIHIGTNDSGGGNLFTNAVDRLDALITRIALCQPSANIIVTSLMPRGEPYNTYITNYFNPFIPGKVAAQQALGRHVTFLDMHAYLTTNDMYDIPPLHPNAGGYAKMAAAWFTAITNVIGTNVTANLPAPIRAIGAANYQQVTISFNKKLSYLTATNAANYSITNVVGASLAVNGASLSADQRTVTLATAVQTKATNYVITVNNVADTNSPALTVAANTRVVFQALTPRGYTNNVADSAGYTMLYSFDIPTAPNYGASTVAYSVDNSARIGRNISRVAYYMELQQSGGDLQYVWASMDAFTNDVKMLGVPTLLSGALFQRYVTNLKVESNQAGVTPGSNYTGNLEFWPYNYSQPNALGIAGASASYYDFGDTCSFSSNYGSMQVHNTTLGKTLFGFNKWGGAGGNADLGIGSRTDSLDTDWTGAGNAGNYIVKTLQVFVKLDASDTTPPIPLSAVTGLARTSIAVTFNESLLASSVSGSCFTLSGGTQIYSATLLSDLRTVRLITAPLPTGNALTLTVAGVRDLAGNPVPAGTTVAVPATLPQAIIDYAGSLATDYQLIYALDIPVTGNFNASPDFYRLNQSAFTGQIDRVAYYVELQKADTTVQNLWVSMDAFTNDTRRLGVPTAASGAVFQQYVSNLVVKCNVAGVSNGTFAAGGYLEFWPTDYGASNAMNVAGASSSTCDFGDQRLTTGTHGSMQIHNAGALQTLFGMNNWGADNQTIALGIGNQSSGSPDWTFAANAGTAYGRRTLYVLVHRKATTVTALPPAVVANVPDVANYQLAYTINLPVNGHFENDASASAYYTVNNFTNGLAPTFSRIAYYFELVPNGSSATQYVWTAMDAFTTDARKIGIPTTNNACFFQQKVLRLDVRSNVGGIVTGSNIDTGNIEIWPSNYGGGNGLPIPNADNVTFDFGDSGGSGTSVGYGCLQVHNYGLGATQTLFAVNNFNNVTGNGNIICVGIGNCTNPVTGGVDWTFNQNAASFSSRRLHVFVLPGICDTVDTTRPTLYRAIAAKALNQVAVRFSETLSDTAATASFFTLNNGATVSAAQLSADKKEVVLTTSALTAGQTYTLTVTGVRDRSSNANAIMPGSTITFTAPTATVPTVLTNVAEASGYDLIQQLAVANTTYYANGCNYSLDESLSPRTNGFDRIAYCMELTGTNGVAKWVYVSMDAFTADITKIGVPTADRGVMWQQYVSNLNVYASANVANISVTTGVGIAAGNVEFWPSSYSAANDKNIPGASATTFDFGDGGANGTTAGHGSMQVHNFAAGHTIFAMNHFGSDGMVPALGIGNNPNWATLNDPDWTQTANASTYSVKNLYVLARPCALFQLVGIPPAIWGQPVSTSAYLGETARFTVYAPDATSFQWRKNGAIIAGATSPWLDIPSASPANAGTYDVLVNGITGNTLSQSATLSVYSYTRPQVPRPIRIMPLGDSITDGAGTAGGYRLPLYTALTSAGYNVDYVGTRNDNGAAGLPDSDHEGLSGWTIGQLDSNIIDWLFAINDPDVILLHIGTNDSGGGTAFTNAVDRLDALVTKIATNRPNANIIVTSLLPRGLEPNNTAITNYFNPYIPGKVAAQRALGRKVFFLDMHAYLTTNDMYDTPPLHPSATGYAKMAAAWYPVITNIVSVYGDTNAPALARGVNTPDLQGVKVTFSKAMDPATVTNIANYALTGGLTISGATLSDDQRTVTLATSPLTRNAYYSVTVTGVKDYSWPTQQTISANNSGSFRATVRGYQANVPEAAGYKLAYAINLPNSPAYSAGNLVSYATNNTALLNGPLKRVAYYLELQRLDGNLTYLWVSMDAFTSDISKIGIPTFASGAFFQKSVANMNVVCNDTNVTSGTGLTGNIEFWSCNYTSGSSGLPTGANDSLFDFGDSPSTGGTYGSMQIHNTLAGKTLFGINNWGSGGALLDIGIGNCPTPINSGVDWTFQNNGPNLPIRSLSVLVTTDADTTPPTLVSAVAGSAGTLVVVTFSEPLAPDTVDGTRFALDNGVNVISATLQSDQRTVYLVTTPQPNGTTLTLTVNGVVDLAGNPIAANSTITVAAPTLPPTLLANVGSLADGYKLVYSLDIPITGTFNGTDPYYYNQSSATGSFDRVAYYMELVSQNINILPPSNATTQYVWAAIDTLTQSRSQIGIPTAASAAVFQQYVSNLVVKSNVSGVSNGTFAAGGNIEFWPTDYTGANGLGITNATGYYDFGDTRSTGGTHGSMQLHNAGLSQVLFAMNNWGANGQPIALGIGNRPGSNDIDWTGAANANTYTRRILHVMIHPTGPIVPTIADTNAPTLSSALASRSLDKVSLTFSETLSDRAALDGTFALNNGVSVYSATLLSDKTTIVLATSPMTAGQNYVVTVSGVRDRSSNGNLISAGSTASFTAPTIGLPTVLTNVPESGSYGLIYQLAVGNTNNYANGCNYTVDESRFAVTQSFDRVAYCMELVTTAGVSNWVYVSMNAFMNDLTKIGVPTANRGAMFQQYVSNLNVYASAFASVTTGTGIPAGNIEFWPSDYTAGNTLNIPGASATAYDFGDGGANGTTAGHGSMQVHNFAAGQTLFSMVHFGRDGYVPGLGIGNQPTGDPDWTFNYNAPSYSIKNIYVLVRWSALQPSQGVGPDIFVQPQPTAKFSGQKATFYVQAVGATAYQWRFNGVWIPGATRSLLELTPATRSNMGSYDVLVYNGSGYTVSQSAALTIFPSGTHIIFR